jgi:hypothetical protein
MAVTPLLTTRLVAIVEVTCPLEATVIPPGPCLRRRRQ